MSDFLLDIEERIIDLLEDHPQGLRVREIARKLYPTKSTEGPTIRNNSRKIYNSVRRLIRRGYVEARFKTTKGFLYGIRNDMQVSSFRRP